MHQRAAHSCRTYAQSRLLLTSHVIPLERDGVHYVLARIDVGTYFKLSRQSVLIQEDYNFNFRLRRAPEQKRVELNLAEMYVTLKTCFGESQTKKLTQRRFDAQRHKGFSAKTNKLTN